MRIRTKKTAPAPPKKSGSGNPGILNADPDLQYSPVKLCPIQYVYTTGSLKKIRNQILKKILPLLYLSNQRINSKLTAQIHPS